MWSSGLLGRVSFRVSRSLRVDLLTRPEPVLLRVVGSLGSGFEFRFALVPGKAKRPVDLTLTIFYSGLLLRDQGIVFSNHFCDTVGNPLEIEEKIVFGVRPFLLYHRSGLHSPQPCFYCFGEAERKPAAREKNQLRPFVAAGLSEEAPRLVIPLSCQGSCAIYCHPSVGG